MTESDEKKEEEKVEAPVAEPNSDIHNSLMNQHSGIVVKNENNKWSDWLTLIDAKKQGFRLYKGTDLTKLNLTEELKQNLIIDKLFLSPKFNDLYTRPKHYLVNSINKSEDKPSEILMIEGYMPSAAAAAEPVADATEETIAQVVPATTDPAAEVVPATTEQVVPVVESVATTEAAQKEETTAAKKAKEEEAAKKAAEKEEAAKKAKEEEAAKEAKAVAAAKEKPASTSKGGYQHKKRKSLKKYRKKSPGK